MAARIGECWKPRRGCCACCRCCRPGATWTSTELATRLGVTTRTIRNDVGRLRGLGYPVDARPGWRRLTGSARAVPCPPLLLDDEEAVAVAIGLRTAASGSVAGIEEDLGARAGEAAQVLPRGCATRSPLSSRLRCRCHREARRWIRTC